MDGRIAPLGSPAWEAWHPNTLSQRLRGIGVPWYIVGGWALDLWHGAQTRVHDDLEFAVLPQHAARIANALTDLAFFASRKGELCHCTFEQPLATDVWQYWGGDIDQGVWRVDMMLERGTLDTWVYKRDPSLKQPRRLALRCTANGIAYLAPANVLLFKAKYCRPKDDADFEVALSKLTCEDAARLRNWLTKLHPEHKWLSALG